MAGCHLPCSAILFRYDDMSIKNTVLQVLTQEKSHEIAPCGSLTSERKKKGRPMSPAFCACAAGAAQLLRVKVPSRPAAAGCGDTQAGAGNGAEGKGAGAMEDSLVCPATGGARRAAAGRSLFLRIVFKLCDCLNFFINFIT